jgi:dynein light chain roadblock-type
VVFEGERGRKYAGVIARIVESVQAGLEEVSNTGVEDSSETVCSIFF